MKVGQFVPKSPWGHEFVFQQEGIEWAVGFTVVSAVLMLDVMLEYSREMTESTCVCVYIYTCTYYGIYDRNWLEIDKSEFPRAGHKLGPLLKVLLNYPGEEALKIFLIAEIINSPFKDFSRLDKTSHIAEGNLLC